jgi:hypothetical protein
MALLTGVPLGGIGASGSRTCVDQESQVESLKSRSLTVLGLDCVEAVSSRSSKVQVKEADYLAVSTSTRRKTYARLSYSLNRDSSEQARR